jgi:Sulfotransferase domain
MNRVTVHIGLPKTATTTLQQKVFASHPGIFYLGPKANYPDFDEVMNGLCFADSLNYDAALGCRVLEKLFPAKDPGKPAVVSQEALSAQGRDRRLKAERLKALFPEARIVLTVRRPEDLLVSVYFQWLKGFGGKRREVPSLDAWLERDWQDAGRGNFLRLQYAKLLELYRSLFGRTNVLLLFFEDLIEDRAKFARQLSEFIGVDSQTTDDLLSQEKSNPRMSSLRYSEVRLYSSVPLLQPLQALKHFLPGSLKSLMKRVQRDCRIRLLLNRKPSSSHSDIQP